MNQIAPPLFCKDCKHVRRKVSDMLLNLDIYKCSRRMRELEPPDPVTGKTEKRRGLNIYESAQIMRMRLKGDDSCGPDAKWFEPRRKPR